MVATDDNLNKNSNVHAHTTDEHQFPYRIASRYHYKGFLGGGGSGLVYKAWDDMLQRMVAIKFIRNPSFVARQRLVAEARALARVNHPSICSIYDIGEPVDEHSSLFMVMELIEGSRLSELAGQLSIADSLKIIHQLCEGVAELHAAGLVHNDINPGNVIIKQLDSDEPLPTLIDLSIAGRPSRNRHQPHVGVTDLFAAPEQLSDVPIAPEALQKVDVYSLGALLFFLITAQAPRNNPETQFKALANDASGALRKFLSSSLAKEPEKRFSNVNEMAEQIGKIRYQTRRQHPLFWAASIITVILLTTLYGITTFSDNQPSGQAGQADTLSNQALWQAAQEHAEQAMLLAKQNNKPQAREATQLSLNYFRLAGVNSVENKSNETVQRLTEWVRFTLAQKALFSASQFSAMLLEVVSTIEQHSSNNEHAELNYLAAKLYYQLALLQQSYSILQQRWLKQAEQMINRALLKAPDSTRYNQLQCKIEYLSTSGDQSSAGTC